MPRYRVRIAGKHYDAMADLVRKHRLNIVFSIPPSTANATLRKTRGTKSTLQPRFRRTDHPVRSN